MTTHAEICPVCEGTANVIIEGYPTLLATQPCHGCNGTGWITVSDEPCNADIFRPGEEIVQEILDEHAEAESNTDFYESVDNTDEADEAENVSYESVDE